MATEDDGAENFDPVLCLFEEHFVPNQNVIFERARFHLWIQAADQSIEQYIQHLYDLAAHCDFHEKEEEIRDRLVIGIRHKDLSLKLQITSDLTLKKAVDIARHSELVKLQNSETGVTGHVDEVKMKPFKSKWKNKVTGATGRHNTNDRGKCGRCGQTHNRDQCPTNDNKCNKCHKMGQK